MINLDSFIGYGGYTTDEEFQLIADLLYYDKNIELLEDHLEEAEYTRIVTEIHRDTRTNKWYEFWYQLPNERSLPYMEFAYGFDRVK